MLTTSVRIPDQVNTCVGNLFETIKREEIRRKVKVRDGNLLTVQNVGKVALWAYNGTKQIKKTPLSIVLFILELKCIFYFPSVMH